MFASFTHTQAMTARRLLIERFSDDSGLFSQIHDTGFVNHSVASGTIFSIDIPPAILKNDDRYRIRLLCRDGLGISGESSANVFDTAYIGAAEPEVTSISADAARAQIMLSWAQSNLTQESFGGYEIARARRDEEGVYELLYREMNQSRTSFIDHYPLSNVDYIYMVRVVELLGADESQGRWSRANMNVNYFPNSFVKDISDPGTYHVAFETAIEAMATPQEDAISEMLIPWGQIAPMVLTRADMRLRSGTVVANFYKDNFQVEDAMLRYQKLLYITNKRPQLCLLLHEPDKERIFASIIGPVTKSFRGVDQRSIEFAYQETSYKEDLRQIEDKRN